MTNDGYDWFSLFGVIGVFGGLLGTIICWSKFGGMAVLMWIGAVLVIAWLVAVVVLLARISAKLDKN